MKLTPIFILLFPLFCGAQIPLMQDTTKLFVFDAVKAYPVTGAQLKTFIGSSGGTVSTVSSGNLSPLFTVGITNPTTAPVFAYTLSTAAANTFFGNPTGSTAAPSHAAAAALTKTDDTNVTLTLGGNASTSLFRAASLTLGWSGTLAASRGGTENGFTAFSGPAASTKTFTLPNASATILTSNALVTVAQGGTGVGTVTGLIQGNGTSAVTTVPNSSTTGQTLRVTGASTYAFGALDLANANAVTGNLPFANGGHDIISGRSTAQTAAVASVATLTVGGADATYTVSGNILVTTSGSESFSLVVDYTDEGNTARSATIPLTRLNGGMLVNTFSSLGAVPYPSVSLQIRCKDSTAITVKTTGTFTGCTYNVEGRITRI